MTNTERLFTAMRDFTDARRGHRDIYLNRKKALEQYKGSTGHQKELDEAMKARREADAAARQECNRIVNETLANMLQKNSAREVTAPTAEDVRILTVAQMLKKPSKAVLDSIANSLGGNALALAALTDIAREAWKDEPNVIDRYITNYEQFATKELSAAAVNEEIRVLRGKCSEIMNGSGANRVREMGADFNTRHYGGSYDPDELPQEEPYADEQDFYKRESGVNYDLFSKAVN